MSERIEEVLCITYNQRNDIKKKGATFVRGNFFTNEKSYWKIDTDENKNINQNALLEYSQAVVSEKKEEEAALYQKWENLLEEGCTLYIAKALHDIGVPKDIAQRVQMLQILNTVSKDQYRISWEYLIEYSDSFKETYGWDNYLELAERKNLGKKDYRVEIETNGLTAEEKAFVRYLFPIGER